MTVADDRLAEVGTGLDAWHAEYAGDLLVDLENSRADEREASVLRQSIR